MTTGEPAVGERSDAPLAMPPELAERADVRRTLDAVAAAQAKVRHVHGALGFEPRFQDALVISASHAIRWREAHLREGAPVPGQATRFEGAGGVPLWDHTLLAAATDAPTTTRKIVLQQDFRFGNAFARGNRKATHVDRALIGPLVDRIVKTRGDVALDRFVRVDNTLVVPWSLLGLRSDARGEAAAPHPVWNIEEWYGTPHAWEELVEDRTRLEEARRTKLDLLFCDRELHPSPIAYLWLSLVAGGLTAGAAMSEALAMWRRVLPQFVSAAPPLRILGDGVVATIPYALLGSGFRTATGMRLVSQGRGGPGVLAKAEALENAWQGLAEDVFVFRDRELAAARRQNPDGARLFLESINPLIDIGTERSPSLIGLVFLMEEHERLGEHATAIRAILAAAAEARPGADQLAK